MLTKAATHLRPLLRFPAHQTPDLFTPNPSLLHHLPQNGVGNSLVSAAQQQAAGSGSGSGAAGAGRAGYQAGSGGYTGHARAFLSLPQTTADSTSASTSADDRERKPTRIRIRTPPRPSSTDYRSRTRPTVRLVEEEPLSFPRLRRKSIAWPAHTSIRALSTIAVDHVVQDLAGLDLPSKRPAQKRRNSTASEVTPDPLASAIQRAVEWGQHDRARALIAHYRNPNPQVEIAHTGYTVSTYNICLSAALSARRRGDSIAPVLDMYNEMLSRDLIPNAKTYSLVIHALVLREADITSAWKRFEGERAWNEWRAEHLNLISDGVFDGGLEAIEGYKAEGNLDSALRLFDTVKSQKLPYSTYFDLVEACATSYRPQPAAALQILRSAEFPGKDRLYAGVLRAHGEAKDDGLDAVWADYTGSDPSVMASAVRAFIAAGKLEIAMSIPTEMTSEIVYDLARAGHVDLAYEHFQKLAKPSGGTTAEMVDALALSGRVSEAVDILCGSEITGARTMRTYAAVLAEGNLDAATKLVHSVPLRFDSDLLAVHINLLVKAGRFDQIASTLDAIPPRPHTQGTSLASVVESTPLPHLLDSIRAFARHDEALTPELATIVLDRYMSARQQSSPIDLGLTRDAWFRLLEASVLVPESMQQFVADLAEIRAAGLAPEGLAFDAVAGELASAYIKQYGESDALAAALGKPNPPTPTLRLSTQLSNFLDKHTAPNGISPQAAYSRLQRDLGRNLAPHPSSLGKLIATFGRLGDEPRARELYALGQVIVSSLHAEGWRVIEDAMLIACCFLGQLENAGMHRARLVDAGMHPSADAYATMIASSKDTTDDATVARELFDESQRFGVVPHLYLYNTIISKLSKARKAESALELFALMKASGIRPSSVTYGAVINACCRVGDAESAATLFDEMASMPNFKPRVPPFNTMMQFHLQTRPSREHVLHYYNAMLASRVKPSSHTYKLLLDAYGTLAPVDLPAMEAAFDEMCRDMNPQGTHYASLITAYAGDIPRAMEVFNSVQAPEPVVWEAIIAVLGSRGTLAQVEEIVARMHASNAGHTAYVCNALITAYASHGAMDSARQVFESMADPIVGVAAPNNHPQLLTSAGHLKPQTTTAEPVDTVFREPSSYEMMIRAELRAGERVRAEDLLRRMEERRYPVAVYMKARALVEEI